MAFRKLPFPRLSAAPKGGMPQYLIVGLGNPGKQYSHTRHNAGFMALEYLSQKLAAPIKRVRFKGLCGTAQLGGKPVLLLMPQTYMNLSGESVAEAARFYKIPPERVVIVYDDKDLPVGSLRLRAKGSAGGHNGVKSIIAHLGTQEFPRLRIGVGAAPGPGQELVDHVLGEFSKAEQKVIFDRLGLVAEGLELLCGEDIAAAQARLNSVRPEPTEKP